MVLVHSIAGEQRTNHITDNISPPSVLGAGMGGGGGARGQIADQKISSLVHAPAPMCGARGDDESNSYFMPYHMHCPTGLSLALSLSLSLSREQRLLHALPHALSHRSRELCVCVCKQYCT
jgi:hypothetical protein